MIKSMNCPNCNGDDTVVIRPGVTEVTCTRCGEQFNVKENENPPSQPSIPVVQPPVAQQENTPQSAPSAPIQPTQYDAPLRSMQAPVATLSASTLTPTPPVEHGKLRTASIDAIANALKNQELPAKLSQSVNPDEFGLNTRIKTSRAWKHAQELGLTGNPFKQNSQSWIVYNCYAEEPRTIIECIIRCNDLGLGKNSFTFIVTIHNVTIDCIAAGLLLIDNETRKIRAHSGKAIPVAIKG